MSSGRSAVRSRGVGARAGLTAIAVVALALRLWGIGFGLPETYHPDEPQYVQQAPGRITFGNPPLFKYLLLGEYGMVYAVGRVRPEPPTRFLIARGTSAVLGAVTVLAVARLAQALATTRAAVIAAAAFMAVAYLPVRESHFGVNDALVTLLMTLGLICCVRIARCGERRAYVAAGALTGLAFGAKYHGLALVVPLVVAHLARRGKTSDLAVAALATVVAAVAAFPSLITETPRVLNDIYVHLYLAGREGYDGVDPGGGYLFYLRTLTLGVGVPMLVASVGGLRRNRQTLVVMSLPLTLFVVLGASSMYFARLILPAVPPLVAVAASGTHRLMHIRWWLGAMAAAVVVAPPLLESARLDVLLTRDDTRTLAQQWVAANLPAEAIIAVDSQPLGPHLTNNHVIQANDGALFDHSLADYRLQGVEYVVTSSFVADAHAVDPEREVKRLQFARDVQKEGTVVAEFRPYDGDAAPGFAYDRIYGPYDALFVYERPGPTVTVYRLDRFP